VQRKWEFKKGARRNKESLPAETVGKELKRLERVHGSLIPEDIVDESRPEDAVLHPEFEWDDGVAGESWRVHQARNLIRIVQLVEEDLTTKAKDVVDVFLHVPVSQNLGRSHYKSGTEVICNTDELTLAFEELQRHVRGVNRTINILKNLAQQHEEHDKLQLVIIAEQAFQTVNNALEAYRHAH